MNFKEFNKLIKSIDYQKSNIRTKLITELKKISEDDDRLIQDIFARAQDEVAFKAKLDELDPELKDETPEEILIKLRKLRNEHIEYGAVTDDEQSGQSSDEQADEGDGDGDEDYPPLLQKFIEFNSGQYQGSVLSRVIEENYDQFEDHMQAILDVIEDEPELNSALDSVKDEEFDADTFLEYINGLIQQQQQQEQQQEQQAQQAQEGEDEQPKLLKQFNEFNGGQYLGSVLSGVIAESYDQFSEHMGKLLEVVADEDYNSELDSVKDEDFDADTFLEFITGLVQQQTQEQEKEEKATVVMTPSSRSSSPASVPSIPSIPSVPSSASASKKIKTKLKKQPLQDTFDETLTIRRKDGKLDESRYDIGKLQKTTLSRPKLIMLDFDDCKTEFYPVVVYLSAKSTHYDVLQFIVQTINMVEKNDYVCLHGNEYKISELTNKDRYMYIKLLSATKRR